MKSLTIILLLASTLGVSAQKADKRYFELRVYYTYPGRMDALLERFQNHTTKIFEQHGMENIGYWVPAGDQNTLYYILAYPNKDARDKSWAAFSADPHWKEVQSKSEESGKIVDSVASVFMNVSADIMPKIKPGKGNGRVFELRTYTCLPGRLPNLITRFKDHTTKLFEKHGMENIVYFTTIEKDGGQPKLVYLLAHKSQNEATKSWEAFRSDPVWVAARDASEKDGKIVEKVASVYMTPTSFSKIK